jgi:hypothetical protein
LSTATQSEEEGHEMPVREALSSTLVTVHADAPPVGVVEVSTLPAESTATQSDAFGQETPERSPVEE